MSRLLVDIVAQYAVLLSARFGKPPDRWLGDIGEHRQEVDMLHRVELTAGWLPLRRTRGKGAQHMLIGRAVADGFQRLLELRGRHGLLVGVKGRLVLPAFDDGEAVGSARFLEDSELHISRFMSAGLAVLLKQINASAKRAGRNVE